MSTSEPRGEARRGNGGEPEGGGRPYRAGVCALVGLPNVGKSTLLNRLVGARLSGVSSKAQTTRRRLRGIYTDDRGQAIFVDTPGRLEPRYALQAGMREEADAAVGDPDLDVVVYVADCGDPRSREAALEFEPPPEAAAVLCLNKTDRAEPGRVDSWLRESLGRGWAEVVPTRADRGEGVEALRDAVLERLPVSPPLYPPEELSTATLREIVAELVREACFEELEEEVPYGVAVGVEEFREDQEPLYIGATLHVERPSQKGIVIGESGRMVRTIGSRARPRIEELVGRQVYLDLWVKVLENWKKRPAALRRLGLPVPEEERTG